MAYLFDVSALLLSAVLRIANLAPKRRGQCCSLTLSRAIKPVATTSLQGLQSTVSTGGAGAVKSRGAKRDWILSGNGAGFE